MQNKKYTEKNGLITVFPTQEHRETLIWLHGLGDTAHGFLDVFTSQNPLLPSSTKVIIPTAPVRKVTLNMGHESTSWFDIKNFDMSAENFSDAVSIEEIQQSTQFVNDLIFEETETLGSATKVFLGGFSQGGCIALHCGLQYPRRIGGIVGLSTFLFPITVMNEANKDTPVLLAHGEKDVVIRWNLAKESYLRLVDKKTERKFFNLHVEPNGGHELPPKTVHQVKAFFDAHIPK